MVFGNRSEFCPECKIADVPGDGICCRYGAVECWMSALNVQKIEKGTVKLEFDVVVVREAETEAAQLR